MLTEALFDLLILNTKQSIVLQTTLSGLVPFQGLALTKHFSLDLQRCRQPNCVPISLPSLHAIGSLQLDKCTCSDASSIHAGALL